MTDENKEPETAQELMDAAFKDAIHGVGGLTNTKAFWIPGVLAGLAGLALAALLVPGEPPLRLVAGLVAFLVLWLTVGTVSSKLSQKGS